MRAYRPRGGANIVLLYDIKLWSKHDIPTKPEYEILCHLASDKDARVYLHEYRDDGAGVTNSREEMGWNTRASVPHLRHGCHVDRRPWVWLDQAATKKCTGPRKVYKISAAGYEAIAQYEARNRYEIEHLNLARRILVECRANVKSRHNL